MPETAPNQPSRWPARAAQVAILAIASGVPAGALYATLAVEPYRQLRDVFPRYLADGVQLCVPAAGAAVLLWALLFRLTARALGSSLGALTATAATLLPPTGYFVLRVNQGYLPDKLEPASLLANALLLVAILVTGIVAAAILRRWQEVWWHTGRVRLIPLAALAALPLVSHFVGHRESDEPDVVVILIDVLRADHLGCYGYERATSPNIDAFAAESILFEDVVAPSTFTKSSIASLFTGLNAYAHKVYLGTFGKDPETVESDVLAQRHFTLAEVLYSLGLNTAAWVQNGQLRAFMGYDQGFSLYRDQPGSIEAIAGEFRDWSRQWSGAGRYFAYLHCIDLHAPYHPKEPFHGMFGPEGSLAHDMDYDSWYEFKGKVAQREITLAQEDIDLFEARYDELIAYTDSWVGRVLDDLRASGRYDDTLIVITADHGEGFWEHEFISHSNIPFEELVHVPMIVKMPHSAGAGRRVESLVGLIDLGPTLIDFVGGRPPDDIHGESFLPLLEGAASLPDPRWRYVEYRRQIAVRTERWKYLSQPGVEPRLFDLAADPGERRDLIHEHPDVAARLEAAVNAARLLREQSPEAERVTLDPETIKSLEELGYL